jgi:hypothetical protein
VTLVIVALVRVVVALVMVTPSAVGHCRNVQ